MPRIHKSDAALSFMYNTLHQLCHAIVARPARALERLVGVACAEEQSDVCGGEHTRRGR